jgi:hypothetical protein
VVVEEVEVQKELFYTEGEDALVEARKAIAAWSLPRAAQRIAAAKQLRQGGLDVLKVRAHCGRYQASAAELKCESASGHVWQIPDMRLAGTGADPSLGLGCTHTNRTYSV